MSFVLTPEQLSLRDAAAALFAAHAGREARRAYVDDAAGYDSELWRRMANELGLHGIAIPEQYGGSGATLLDLVIVLEQAGAALLCSPFFASVVLAATAVTQSGDEGAMTRLLPPIASGEMVAALAYRTRATATRNGDAWTLSGPVEYVVDGCAADVIVAFARAGEDLRLFVTAAANDTVKRTEAPVLDPTRRLADIEFTDTPAHLITEDGDSVLRRTLAVAQVALAAEQVGAAQQCLDMAVEYAKSRHQFGRPIGSFQAIKHRCADMFVDVQCSRATTRHAAWAYDADPDAFDAASHLTGALVSDAFYRTAAHNMQIHGGIGFTWEHDAHLYLKRAISSARLLHTPQEHRRSTANRLGLRLPEMG